MRISKHASRTQASIPTIRRLPSYLEIAHRYKRAGEQIISGKLIGEELDLDSIQVRKDLSVTGIAGKPRVGYFINDLIEALERFLGWDKQVNAIIVGAGNLGSALMGYTELKNHGLTFVAAFDTEEKNHHASGITIHRMDQMVEVVSSWNVRLAILTVPRAAAREASNILLESGIKQIWNFTNARLIVPDDVMVLQEDLSSGYAVLTALNRVH